MSLVPLRDSFGRWGGNQEFGRRLLAATVTNAANELSQGRFKAVTFRAGALTLEVASGAARYVLQPELPELISAINTKLGRPAVQRIKFRLAPVD